MDNNVNGFIGFPIQNANTQGCGCQGGNTYIPDNNVGNGNMQRTLANYLGRRVTCEFSNQCGTTRKSGILSGIGNDYILLTNNSGGCMLCHTQDLNFVTIGG